jgi:hypothetical protein
VSDPPPGGPPQLPPDLPPEYAEAYLQAYERAYAEAAELEPAAPSAVAADDGPPEDGEDLAGQHEHDQVLEEEGTDETSVEQGLPEPWRYEPPPDEPGPDLEPSRTWAFEPPEEPPMVEQETVDEAEEGNADQQEPTDTTEQEAVDPDHELASVVPGFAVWEGYDDDHEEAPHAEGYPRWVMPFLAVCLIVLLFLAVYLLA